MVAHLVEYECDMRFKCSNQFEKLNNRAELFVNVIQLPIYTPNIYTAKAIVSKLLDVA